MKKLLFLAAIIIVITGCKSSKKNRCNTCPKWDDRIELTQEVGGEKFGQS